MGEYDIKIEDLPGEFRAIAEAIGLKNALALVRMCGGQSTYIPKLDTCERAAKARRIFEEYRASTSGLIFSELASKYNYTESHIRRIINDFNLSKYPRREQLELF